MWLEVVRGVSWYGDCEYYRKGEIVYIHKEWCPEMLELNKGQLKGIVNETKMQMQLEFNKNKKMERAWKENCQIILETEPN